MRTEVGRTQEEINGMMREQGKMLLTLSYNVVLEMTGRRTGTERHTARMLIK